MDSLRNAAKSWVAKLLIGLLAVSFGVWGIADVFRGYNQGSLASVGDVQITPAEYSSAFSRYQQNLQRQTGQAFTSEEARKFGIDRVVLDNLIQTAAIDSQAQSLKLAVSDALIVSDTAKNPAFQDSAGKFDPAEFRRRLDASGLNEGMFLQSERQGRTLQEQNDPPPKDERDVHHDDSIVRGGHQGRHRGVLVLAPPQEIVEKRHAVTDE